jgi:hypothetical protein
MRDMSAEALRAAKKMSIACAAQLGGPCRAICAERFDSTNEVDARLSHAARSSYSGTDTTSTSWIADSGTWQNRFSRRNMRSRYWIRPATSNVDSPRIEYPGALGKGTSTLTTAVCFAGTASVPDGGRS